MAITTDSYYDIVYQEQTLDRIGLSKTLDNYTIEEIVDYAFVGSYSYYGRQISEKSLPDYTYVGYSTLHGSCPFAASFNAPNYDQIWCDNGNTTHYNLTDNGIYRSVCLMHRTNNDPYPYQLTENDFEYMQIITEMDAPKYSVNFGNTEDMEFSDTPYWRPHDFTSKYNTHLGAVDNVEIATCGFVPYIVLQFQEHYFFINANTIWTGEFSDAPSFAATYINNSARSVCANQLYDYTTSYYAGISEAVDQWFQSYDFTNPMDTPFVKTVNLSTPEEYWCQYDGYASRIGFQYSAEDGFSQYFCFTDEDKLLLYIAGICGLHFIVDGTVYKPIITDNFVIGYSDDLTVTSDLDSYIGSTKHDLPVTPPGPTPPTPEPWDVDPETYGWSGGEVSGMVKYYLLTAGQMSSLQTAMASNANWTIDYLNCIVSCFVVPNDGIFFDAPISTTVKFKLDNATEWDTGVGCLRIQGTKSKSGGTIEIPRLTNTFYDFEPYSDYSVYIPFCGRVPIKGNVCLGHEIKVTYYPDVPTCSLTAVVSCGGATIAIAKGSFGTMTPVTSNGSDRKTAAVIGDVAPIITGIGTGIVGVALGNPLIVGAGAAQALGGIMGGVKETVQSYAYSVGSTGDSSFFSAGNRCYYYANYPLIDEVVNNSMFGHSVGYLCNTVGKLSGFKGFTICANPHVTFSASSEEREEIERLLSMGVIL